MGTGFSELKPFQPLDPRYAASMKARSSFDRLSGKLVFDFIFIGDARKAGLDGGFSGDSSRLGASERQGAADRRDELWKSACLEAFVIFPTESIYWEFNFSPSRGWNVYRFEEYRQGMAPETSVAAIESRKLTSAETAPARKQWRFELATQAESELGARLAQAKSPNQACVGLACVLREGESTPASYWALDHFGAKPDFHLQKSFTSSLSESAGTFSLNMESLK